jgi:ribosome-binding protein aMBF1 (putative translation factor)
VYAATNTVSTLALLFVLRYTPYMTLRQIGRRFFELRKDRGLSCRAVASKADCAASTVLRVEAGQAVPSSILYRMARALGTRLELL